MPQARSPVPLFSHLSSKLCEFCELLPTAFQQRSEDCIKEPFPALELIRKLQKIVKHELLASDYDGEAKGQLKQICRDLDRMVSTTESAVAICVAPKLIAFHATIRGFDEYLYRAAQLLISFIRSQLCPLIDAMISKAEKEAGQPTAICINPYKPWDALDLDTISFRDLSMRIKDKPLSAMVDCVAHRCGNPNKEAWPKCCREASIALSKQMEEHYLMGKRC